MFGGQKEDIDVGEVWSCRECGGHWSGNKNFDQVDRNREDGLRRYIQSKSKTCRLGEYGRGTVFCSNSISYLWEGYSQDVTNSGSILQLGGLHDRSH